MASSKEIPPGGEGKIDVKYKTSTKIGSKTQTISVHTNDPEQKVVKIKLKMNIHAVLAIQPHRMRFGQLRKGTDYPVQYASLIGSEKGRAKIISAKSKNEYIAVETGVFESGNNTEEQVKVTVLPGMRVGQFSDQIKIKTDYKKMKDLKIYVSGEVVGNIILSRKHLSFGLFKKGGRYEKSIRLTAAQGVSFKVLDVKSSIPGLHTKVITIQEGSRYKINAYIEKDFKADSLDGKIQIVTDDENQKTIEINVFGKASRGKPIGKKSKGANPPNVKKSGKP